MRLLGGRFEPITFGFGFIKCPFDKLANAYSEWQGRVTMSFQAWRMRKTLSHALAQLDPVTAPITRDLLIETTSEWTAYLSNGVSGTDAVSFCSYLSGTLRTSGLLIESSPDIVAPTGKQICYGSVRFDLYGPEDRGISNLIRGVSATHAEEWHFSTYGEVQPFEEVANYKARRIRDRFTPDMLDRYCRAVGVRPFAADFYGENCLLATTDFGQMGRVQSIKDRQRELGLMIDS